MFQNQDLSLMIISFFDNSDQFAFSQQRLPFHAVKDWNNRPFSHGGHVESQENSLLVLFVFRSLIFTVCCLSINYLIN